MTVREVDNQLTVVIITLPAGENRGTVAMGLWPGSGKLGIIVLGAHVLRFDLFNLIWTGCSLSPEALDDCAVREPRVFLQPEFCQDPKVDAISDGTAGGVAFSQPK